MTEQEKKDFEWASGYYLYDDLDADWVNWDEEKLYNEIEQLAWQPFEHWEGDKLYIEIDENPGISAEILYKNHTLTKRSLLSPGIMGWYSYMPFMECYHGLVSLDNDIEGFIQFGDKITDLTGGKGYIEKDWGVSFPKSWLWLQCNTFDNEKTSFFFSIAHIPWLGKYFIGYISVLLFEGKVHKFATYNNAKLDHIKLDENSAEIRLRNNDIELNVHAFRKNGSVLQAPTLGKMDRRISESIDADISLEIKTKNGTKILNGINTGMELVGDISELTNKQKIK